MKILLVSNYAHPHIGGIESIIALEIRLLIEQNHDVILVTSDCGIGRNAAHNQITDRFKIYRIRAWNILEHRANISWPIFSPAVIIALWRGVHWCDVVHVHGHIFMTSPIALIFAKIFKKRALLSMHGRTVLYSAYGKKFAQFIIQETIGRLCFKLADVITTQSRKDSVLLQKQAARHTHIELLLNPLQYTYFYPPTEEQRHKARIKLSWEDKRIKVLYVGPFRQSKGVDLLIKAHDPAYDIIFCGAYSQTDHEQITHHKMFYLPPRSQHEMITLYHAADILILPSRSEGNPMVVNEAITCGLPVILARYDNSEIYDTPLLSNVYFCDYSPESIKATIKNVISLSHTSTKSEFEHTNALNKIFPDEENWVTQIVGLMNNI